MKNNVLIEKKEEIAIVKLNRPRSLNAVTDELLSDFLEILIKVREDKDIKVVILTGEGRAFCAGADIKEQVVPKDLKTYWEHSKLMQNVTRTIVNLGKPIIAAIKGYALGEGMELSLNCDVRIVAENSKVGFPESRVGATVTNAGTYYLPRIVGLGKAKEMMLTGEPIDAAEAYRVGYANKIVRLEDLEAEAFAMAEKIASNYDFEVGLQKQMLEVAMDSSLEGSLAFETYCACASFAAGSRKEGMSNVGKSKD